VRAINRGDAQLVLPGIGILPRRIVLPDGSRKLLDNATVQDVRAHLKALRQRLLTSHRVLQIQKVVELMSKYAAEHRGITWAEVKKLELEKLD
jgi:hypothetical protein